MLRECERVAREEEVGLCSFFDFGAGAWQEVIDDCYGEGYSRWRV